MSTIEVAITKHPNGYRTSEVARLSGASERMIEYWWTTNVLPPSIQQTKGSGGSRYFTDGYRGNLYSFTDIVAAAVLNEVSQPSTHLGPANLIDSFRNKSLPLALEMMVAVYDDWDGVVVISDHQPEIMPSIESAVARIVEAQGEHPAITTILIRVGPLAERVAKGILDVEAAV